MLCVLAQVRAEPLSQATPTTIFPSVPWNIKEPDEPHVGGGTWAFSKGVGVVLRSASPLQELTIHTQTYCIGGGTVLLEGRWHFNRLYVMG